MQSSSVDPILESAVKHGTRATLRTSVIAPEEYRPPCNNCALTELSMQISGLGEHARDIYAFGVLTLKALLGPSVHVLHGDDDWEPPSALIDQHHKYIHIRKASAKHLRYLRFAFHINLCAVLAMW